MACLLSASLNFEVILSSKSAKIVRKMWEESILSIIGIDFDHLSFYLGKHLSAEEIAEEAFEELLYTKVVKPKNTKLTKRIGRKHVKNNPKGRHSKQSKQVSQKVFNTSMGADTHETGAEVKSRNEGVDKDTATLVDKENEMVKTIKAKKKTQEWKKPVRKPTKDEERKMFGKALEIMLTLCMDNHCYQFNNQIRIQKKGGPIGLKLTGEIADCIMLDWEKTLLAELKKLEIIPEI